MSLLKKLTKKIHHQALAAYPSTVQKLILQHGFIIHFDKGTSPDFKEPDAIPLSKNPAKTKAYLETLLKQLKSKPQSPSESPQKPDSEVYHSIHTHGFNELLHHPELEICYPLPENVIQHIFAQIYLMIKEDHHMFRNNELIHGILTLPLKAVARTDLQNHAILRILIPDSNGYFPDNPNCNPEYQEQDEN